MQELTPRLLSESAFFPGGRQRRVRELMHPQSVQQRDMPALNVWHPDLRDVAAFGLLFKYSSKLQSLTNSVDLRKASPTPVVGGTGNCAQQTSHAFLIREYFCEFANFEFF